MNHEHYLIGLLCVIVAFAVAMGIFFLMMKLVDHGRKWAWALSVPTFLIFGAGAIFAAEMSRFYVAEVFITHGKTFQVMSVEQPTDSKLGKIKLKRDDGYEMQLCFSYNKDRAMDTMVGQKKVGDQITRAEFEHAHELEKANKPLD